MVTVVAADPPLYASRPARPSVDRNVKLALIWLAELNETLCVVNAPHGPDRYQLVPDPQSMVPAGYWPVSDRFGGERSSKVTIVEALAIVSVAFAECVRLPLVPVIVNAYDPVGVVELVVTFNVEEPDPAIDGGLNDAVVPLGMPLTLRLTVPVNPPVAAMVAV